MRSEVFVMELGDGCNNNCIFCMENNQKSKVYTLEFLKETAKTHKRVELTHGEPTLNKKIFEYAEMAKIAGFKEIEVTSNGRMFAVSNFAEKLAKSGVKKFKLSIHGATPQIHNAMTRTPQSFNQAISGLKKIEKIKEKYGLKIHILMVITKLNYKEMSDALNLFLNHKVDMVIFNLFESRGHAKKRSDLLMPDYVLVEEEFNKAIEKNQSKLNEKGVDVAISLPICILGDKLKSRFSNFEVVLIDEGKVIQKSPTQRGKVFTSECKKCSVNSICDGVWEDYLRIYGKEAFKAQSTDPKSIRKD